MTRYERRARTVLPLAEKGGPNPGVLMSAYVRGAEEVAACTHHVEVEEGEEVEEGAAEADGGGGPERGQHQADVVDEGQLGGVHSR